MDHLKTEIAVEEATIKKIGADKANLAAEDEFLQKYVKAAEDNRKSLEDVLTKIEKVDKDAVTAAQAAKKKS